MLFLLRGLFLYRMERLASHGVERDPNPIHSELFDDTTYDLSQLHGALSHDEVTRISKLEHVFVQDHQSGAQRCSALGRLLGISADSNQFVLNQLLPLLQKMPGK
jgi:hypothetical protein